MYPDPDRVTEFAHFSPPLPSEIPDGYEIAFDAQSRRRRTAARAQRSATESGRCCQKTNESTVSTSHETFPNASSGANSFPALKSTCAQKIDSGHRSERACGVGMMELRVHDGCAVWRWSADSPVFICEGKHCSHDGPRKHGRLTPVKNNCAGKVRTHVYEAASAQLTLWTKAWPSRKNVCGLLLDQLLPMRTAESPQLPSSKPVHGMMYLYGS